MGESIINAAANKLSVVEELTLQSGFSACIYYISLLFKLSSAPYIAF